MQVETTRLILGKSCQRAPTSVRGADSVQDRLSQELNPVEIDCDGVVKYSGIDAENMPLRRKLWRSDEDA
jgi:hypothetical protein